MEMDSVKLRGALLRFSRPLMTIDPSGNGKAPLIFVNGQWIEEQEVFLDIIATTSNVHLLPVIIGENWLETLPISTGLFLEPTGITKGQFRRVGMCRLHLWSVPSCSGFSNTNNQDYLEYERFDGVGKYTISVV